VNLKQEIFEHFGPTVFHRPLFYSYPGGLRFELSTLGSTVARFLLALRRATAICTDIFIDEPIVVCLRVHSGTSHVEHRGKLESLKSAGIIIPAQRTIWSEEIDSKDWFCNSMPEYWVYLSFEAPMATLETLLWCALAKDFPAIQPKPYCDIYLFNLQKKVLALPYDDRGMDVVGPNRKILSALYEKHQSYLLGYDRQAMDKCFASR
jgi:hypothetical protein